MKHKNEKLKFLRIHISVKEKKAQTLYNQMCMDLFFFL